MASSAESIASDSRAALSARYADVRGLTVELCATLAPEDTVVQSMPDVSPTKWHLAHVTWFWERFVLESHVDGYTPYDASFDFILNSYYYTAGQMYPRPKRGLLSRPTFDEVLAYRRHADDTMQDLIAERGDDPEFTFLVDLGLNHEQQHQELLLTDIKHVFSVNPALPVMNPGLAVPPSADPGELAFTSVDGGIHRFGSTGDGFSFDNETPRHDALLHDHAIADRLITNAEYRAFIDAGGYEKPELWLSDGWAAIHERGWNRPLYWSEDLESEFTLGGQRDIDPHAPVTHVSYYEADAFARFVGARLPTEFEWEHAAVMERVAGNLLETGHWQPAAGQGKQYFGDNWEWTSSPYAPYPGFTPLAGSLGEYNGKFMCNQMTVRGGSCVTSTSHIRASYRSFFYPHQRWQFLGFRLAKDTTS